MSLNVLGSLVARYGPEAAKYIQDLLQVLRSAPASADKLEKVVDAASQGAEVVSAISSSTTGDDNGASQATHLAKQHVLSHLQGLVGSLNGHDPERKDLLMRLAERLVSEEDELTPDRRTQLRGILEEMISSGEEVSGATNEDKTPKDTGDRPKTDPNQGAKADEKATSQDRDKKADNKDTGNPKTSTNPFDILTANVKKIIRRELINKSSWMGLAAQIAESTGLGKIDDVEDFIEKKLMTSNFMGALQNSILGKEINTEGFNQLQLKAFKVAKWGMWVIDKVPNWGIQYFPLVSTVLKFTMPLWTHLPFVNKFLSTTYPFIDELAGFVGKFQDENHAIKDAIKQMKEQHAQTTAKSAPQAQAEAGT